MHKNQIPTTSVSLSVKWITPMLSDPQCSMWAQPPHFNSRRKENARSMESVIRSPHWQIELKKNQLARDFILRSSTTSERVSCYDTSRIHRGIVRVNQIRFWRIPFIGNLQSSNPDCGSRPFWDSFLHSSLTLPSVCHWISTTWLATWASRLSFSLSENEGRADISNS